MCIFSFHLRNLKLALIEDLKDDLLLVLDRLKELKLFLFGHHALLHICKDFIDLQNFFWVGHAEESYIRRILTYTLSLQL